MQWYCRLVIKNSVLDSLVYSWDPLIWETADPRTHKPKNVNESLLRVNQCTGGNHDKLSCHIARLSYSKSEIK